MCYVYNKVVVYGDGKLNSLLQEVCNSANDTFFSM